MPRPASDLQDIEGFLTAKTLEESLLDPVIALLLVPACAANAS